MAILRAYRPSGLGPAGRRRPVRCGLHRHEFNRMTSSTFFFLFLATIAAGLISIGRDSLVFTRLMALGGWEDWILVLMHFAATALLGSMMLTMVFGHWYLVIPRLSIEPLMKLTKVLMGAIGI